MAYGKLLYCRIYDKDSEIRGESRLAPSGAVMPLKFKAPVDATRRVN